MSRRSAATAWSVREGTSSTKAGLVIPATSFRHVRREYADARCGARTNAPVAAAGGSAGPWPGPEFGCRRAKVFTVAARFRRWSVPRTARSRRARPCGRWNGRHPAPSRPAKGTQPRVARPPDAQGHAFVAVAVRVAVDAVHHTEDADALRPPCGGAVQPDRHQTRRAVPLGSSKAMQALPGPGSAASAEHRVRADAGATAATAAAHHAARINRRSRQSGAPPPASARCRADARRGNARACSASAG
jgi:hypothetical protein